MCFVHQPCITKLVVNQKALSLINSALRVGLAAGESVLRDRHSGDDHMRKRGGRAERGDECVSSTDATQRTV